MLTARSSENIAYLPDSYGDIICPECAAEAFTTVGVHRADLGMDPYLTPYSRYTVTTEFINRHAEQYADDQSDEDDPRVWERLYDKYPKWHPCGRCGKEIS